MIALALGAILLAASLEIYTTSRASWADQRLGAVVVENGRVMSQVLRSSFSNAGYYGCLPDSNDKLFLNKTSGVSGLFPYVHAASASSASSLGVTRSVESDIVTTYSVVNSTAVTTTQEHVLNRGDSDQRVLVFNSSMNFNVDDIVVLSNCNQATAIKVSAVDGANNSITYAATNCEADAPGCTYSASTTVMKLATRRFYVAENGRGGSSFYMKFDNGAETELIEGVDSVTVLYGVDAQTYASGAFSAGSDGSIERYVTRSQVNDWGNVIAVRFDYTISSLGNNAVERDFSTVAMIRNFRMN
jgi:Tfp pilus assembly protein PilW